MLNNGNTYDFYAIKITSTDEGALLMTNLASSSGSESEAVTIGTVGNYINLKLLFVKGENDTMEKLEVYVNGTLAATYATAYGTFTNTYGKTFTEVASKAIEDIDNIDDGNGCLDYTLTFDATTAKYLKVVAESYTELPQWHPGAGNPGFLFVDEVIVK
jgi:hypothetical protein